MSVFPKSTKIQNRNTAFETLSAFVPTKKKHGKATIHFIHLDGAVTVTQCRPL